MASKKSDSAAADIAADIAALQAELAALRKEVAALKSQLSKKSSGGADPRVDKIVEAILLSSTNSSAAEKILKSL